MPALHHMPPITCPPSQVLQNRYPKATDNKGVLLVVTAAKEGALIGGEKFNKVRRGHSSVGGQVQREEGALIGGGPGSTW